MTTASARPQSLEQAGTVRATRRGTTVEHIGSGEDVMAQWLRMARWLRLRGVAHARIRDVGPSARRVLSHDAPADGPRCG